MISASQNPPVVYLQNLALRTPALQLSPTASTTPVVVATFHPDRPNIFLLAFKDGTLAAYDATKMARRNGVRMDVNSSLEKDGSGGEIARFKRLHRTTNHDSTEEKEEGLLEFRASFGAVGSKSVGITGAAFMSGHRYRAVSVGGDGKCRIVDFEDGGQVLRTWHAQAPVTSLAVLSVNKLRPSKTGQKSGTSTNSTFQLSLIHI